MGYKNLPVVQAYLYLRVLTTIILYLSHLVQCAPTSVESLYIWTNETRLPCRIIVEAVLVESIHRERYNIYTVHEHSNNINNNNDIRYYGNVYWVIVFCRFGTLGRIKNTLPTSKTEISVRGLIPVPVMNFDFCIHQCAIGNDPWGYCREIYTMLTSMILTTEAKTLDVEQ